MRWTWDPEKERANRRKHGLRFETAQRVFEDPLAMSRQDAHPDGRRWHTVGLIGPAVVLVVHTWPEPDPATGGEVGRIISARKATRLERRAYEEGDL